MTWSCSRCTFENEGNARQCAMCFGARLRASSPKTSAVSPGNTTKKAKVKATQSPSHPFGSSVERELQRVQHKVEQLKELGISLPDDEMKELLQRNCFSVSGAASAYFDHLGQPNSVAADKEAKHRLEQLLDKVKNGVEAFHVLGKMSVQGSVNRPGVQLQVGEELLLQAESAGKKRLKPGLLPTSMASGMVRVSTMHHALIGRLERNMELLLHPLMKGELVKLMGMCEKPPVSSHMFASFGVTVVICVSDKAFDAFKESSPNFHLADLLYNLFQKVHEARAPSLDAPSASGVDPENLDMLFSECTGVNELENSVDGTNNDPTEYLTQYLNNIELREHQKQALRWTLWREDQSRSEEENVDPMWEKRDFHFKGSYYVNPLEKSASLSQPERPRPCRGGILADDMGMGKTMVMLSLIAYQKHFREERAMTNHLEAREIRKAASKTLVVCPLSLLHQWKREAYERFVSNTLSVHVYYGNDGTTSTGLTTTPFGNSDVVLTTYGVLSAEFRKNGLVATTEWLRVILDEAHSIKNRATHYFKTCSALKATHRWCLTGTPIQNSLEDLFSLLCFLEYEPWSRAAWWKRVINKPYEDGDVNALGRLKAILTPLLLRRTKHSRDRHGHRIVDLPPKHIELVQLDFSPDERAFYQALYDQSRAEFNGFVASGTAMTSYVAIFALLLRLRQACDHPLLALGKDVEQELKPTEASATSAFQRQDNESPEAYYQRIAAQLQKDLVKSHLTQHLVNDADGLRRKETLVGGLTASYIQSVIAQVEDGLESQECPICLDSPRSAVLTPCAHVLCDQCLRDSIEMDPGNGCPVCRTAVDLAKVFKLPPPSASRAPTNDFQAVEGSTNESLAGDVQERVTVFESAKMKQLLGDLNALKLENGKTASSTQKRKVVVFSQWTSMLQMVSRLLTTHGVSHCTFSGDVKHVGRERVLRTFATDPDVEVLLMSLKAGGLGLNLTCASVVILLDPWWNPGVEEQAIDRVHRLGQTQHVTVKRYVMKETVEDMMLQLQERKATLAKNVLVPAKAAYEERQRERLTLDDLRTFFR